MGIHFLDQLLLFLLTQPRPLLDGIHLLPDTLIAGPVPDLACQRTQILNIRRLIDHAGHALDVLVKALYSVIGCIEAQALLGIAEPLNARLEGVRQAVDGGRQRIDPGVDPQRSAKLCQDAVAVARLEMREVTASVVNRLIAVCHKHPVHLLEQRIIDVPDLLHGLLNLALVQIGSLCPQLFHHGAPLGKIRAGPVLDPPPGILQHPDIVLRLAQQLHCMRFAHQIALGNLRG